MRQFARDAALDERLVDGRPRNSPQYITRGRRAVRHQQPGALRGRLGDARAACESAPDC